MSGDKPTVWNDPNVKAAFANGRAADDICVLNCPLCGELSYYNQSSWFTCRHCDRAWYVLAEDEYPPFKRCEYMRPDVILTMQDVVEAECKYYP